MKTGSLLLSVCFSFTFILLGCRNNQTASNRQEETHVTSIFTKKSASASVHEEEVGQNDTSSLQQRVAHIYDDVFLNYNKGDYSDKYKKYFSKRLEVLWNTLPDDYAVVDADPWTWSVEFDSCAFKEAVMDKISDDSATVIVTSQLYAHYDTMQMVGLSERMLKLVRETKCGVSDWFVDDMTDARGNMDISVSTIIHHHNANMEVIQTAENLYNKLFEKYNSNEPFESEKHFSERLKSLFDKLPTDDIVFDADIWIGLQDYDSLLLRNVSVEAIKQDTASVKIEFQVFSNVTRTIHVRFIHENNGWKTDDIIHNRMGKAYSVAETAYRYMEQSIVR